jgi:hypothetical protein
MKEREINIFSEAEFIVQAFVNIEVKTCDCLEAKLNHKAQESFLT